MNHSLIIYVKYTIYEKKRLKSKLCRKYELNLLNEPQHLAEIKTPKLLKILNKGVTNLRERKLKNMQLTKIPRKQIKSMRENVHVSLPMLSLGFFDVIGEIKRAAREYKKNTKGGGEEEKNCYLKFKSERDFLQFT